MTEIVRIKPRPVGLERPSVRRIIRVMSKVNVAIYRWTGGVLGSRWRVGAAFPWGVPVLLLTTRGRRTGKLRVAPLLYIEDGNDIVVVASQGGLPRNPLWYENIQADASVQIQIGRRKMAMKARTASTEERARLWPRLVAHYADFASYAAWTDRELPVVICEPV